MNESDGGAIDYCTYSGICTILDFVLFHIINTIINKLFWFESFIICGKNYVKDSVIDSLTKKKKVTIFFVRLLCVYPKLLFWPNLNLRM